MERLIEIMNKLQDLSNTSGVDLPTLPQIVVIGEQSSGKSSVLESLVKQPILPRGEGLVTRCPIVLQLINTPFGGTEDVGAGGCRPAEEWCEFLHKPHHVYTDYEDAREEIQAQVNRLAGSNKGIVSDRITVKVFSPRVMTLTVVDLPGLVKVPIGDQPDNIEDQVNELVESFIEDKKTIILAVSPAVQDIAAAEAVKLARKFDPEGLRTVVVLTKLDMMSAGSNAEDTLRGRTLPVKLGIVGVVNRSPKDNKENKNIEMAILDEETFLKKHYPALATQNGCRYLARKLQKILMEHIRLWIPEMLKQVNDMSQAAKKELVEYGKVPTSKQKELLELIKDFSRTVDSAIDGKGRRIPKKVLLGGEKINHVFDNVLRAELEHVDPNDISDKEILITVANSEGIEHSCLNPERAFRELVKEKIMELEGPVLRCAKYANKEMMDLMSICLREVGKRMYRFPGLVSAIKKEVNAMLAEFYEDVEDMLRKYVRIQGSYTHTSTEKFKIEMEGLVKQAAVSKGCMGMKVNGRQVFVDEDDDEEEITYPQELSGLCNTVRKLIAEYFRAIQAACIDFVPKVVVCDVVYKLQENLHNTLTEKLYTPDRIEILMEEEPDVAQSRIEAKRRLEALKEAAKILTELRDSELKL